MNSTDNNNQVRRDNLSDLSGPLKDLITDGDRSYLASALPARPDSFSEEAHSSASRYRVILRQEGVKSIFQFYRNYIINRPCTLAYTALVPCSTVAVVGNVAKAAISPFASMRQKVATLAPAERAALFRQVKPRVAQAINPDYTYTGAGAAALGLTVTFAEFANFCRDGIQYAAVPVKFAAQMIYDRKIKQYIPEAVLSHARIAADGAHEVFSSFMSAMVDTALQQGQKMLPSVYKKMTDCLQRGDFNGAISYLLNDLQLLDETLEKVDLTLEATPVLSLVGSIYTSLSRLTDSNNLFRENLGKVQLSPEKMYMRQIRYAAHGAIFPSKNINEMLAFICDKSIRRSTNINDSIIASLNIDMKELRENESEETTQKIETEFTGFCKKMQLNHLPEASLRIIHSAFIIDYYRKNTHMPVNPRTATLYQMILCDPHSFIYNRSSVTYEIFKSQLGSKLQEWEKEIEESFIEWSESQCHEATQSDRSIYTLQYICLRRLKEEKAKTNEITLRVPLPDKGDSEEFAAQRKRELRINEETIEQLTSYLTFAENCLNNKSETEYLMEAAAKLYIKENLYPVLLKSFLPDDFPELVSGLSKLLDRDLHDLCSTTLAQLIYENAESILTDPHLLTTTLLSALGGEVDKFDEYRFESESEAKHENERLDLVFAAQDSAEFQSAIRQLQLMKTNPKGQLFEGAKADFQKELSGYFASYGRIAKALTANTASKLGRDLPALAEKKDWGMVVLALTGALCTCLENPESVKPIDLRDEEAFEHLKSITKDLLPAATWLLPVIKSTVQGSQGALEGISFHSHVSGVKLMLKQEALQNKIISAMKFSNNHPFPKIAEDKQELWKAGFVRSLNLHMNDVIEKVWGLTENDDNYNIAKLSYLEHLLEVPQSQLLNELHLNLTSPAELRAARRKAVEERFFNLTSSTWDDLSNSTLDLSPVNSTQLKQIRLELASINKKISQFLDLKKQRDSLGASAKASQSPEEKAAQEIALRDVIQEMQKVNIVGLRKRKKQLEAHINGPELRKKYADLLNMKKELEIIYALDHGYNLSLVIKTTEKKIFRDEIEIGAKTEALKSMLSRKDEIENQLKLKSGKNRKKSFKAALKRVPKLRRSRSRAATERPQALSMQGIVELQEELSQLDPSIRKTQSDLKHLHENREQQIKALKPLRSQLMLQREKLESSSKERLAEISRKELYAKFSDARLNLLHGHGSELDEKELAEQETLREEIEQGDLNSKQLLKEFNEHERKKYSRFGKIAHFHQMKLDFMGMLIQKSASGNPDELDSEKLHEMYSILLTLDQGMPTFRSPKEHVSALYDELTTFNRERNRIEEHYNKELCQILSQLFNKPIPIFDKEESLQMLGSEKVRLDEEASALAYLKLNAKLRQRRPTLTRQTLILHEQIAALDSKIAEHSSWNILRPRKFISDTTESNRLGAEKEKLEKKLYALNVEYIALDKKLESQEAECRQLRERFSWHEDNIDFIERMSEVNAKQATLANARASFEEVCTEKAAALGKANKWHDEIDRNLGKAEAMLRLMR
ncbi:hypothetical protein SCG7109_AG_00290 [Chlamydiales bacterium SCGC AG-110-M15]|nr:hypothetical protein SCG7109_AG_00290 [Chlamydiales bacterium SCGC AG-110-M15]